jgi:hypothetical protein
MAFIKGHPKIAGRAKGTPNRKILTRMECRAIFDEVTSRRLPEIISRLSPSYIAKNRLRIILAIQKAERLRGEGSLASLSDSVQGN